MHHRCIYFLFQASENCTNWSCGLITSVWGPRLRTCPNPGSLWALQPDLSVLALLSSASPWWLTAPGLCFDLCLSFWEEESISAFFLNPRHEGMLSHSVSNISPATIYEVRRWRWHPALISDAATCGCTFSRGNVFFMMFWNVYNLFLIFLFCYFFPCVMEQSLN